MHQSSLDKAAAKLQSIWNGWSNFAPKILLAFIGFVLVVFALQVSGPLAGIFAENANPAECADKVKIEVTERTFEEGKEARLKGKVTNSCDKKVEFWMRKFWCEEVKDNHQCGDNDNNQVEIIAPNSTYNFDVRQAIGRSGTGDGTCGSAQIDVRFSRNLSAAWPNEAALAWSESCRPRVRCEKIEIKKIGTQRRVEVKVFGFVLDGGQITKYRYDFGDGSGIQESVQPDNMKTHDYANTGSYNIQAWVVGDNGKQDSSVACKGTVTFENEKHFVCENNACKEKAGPGQNTGGCNAGNVGTACGVQEYHYKCKDNACARFNGSGQNTDGCNAGNIGASCGQQQQQAFCDNLSLSITRGNNPLTVTATLTGHTLGGGSIDAYRIMWGDGTQKPFGPGNSATHTFTNPGTFTIEGRVRDNQGNEAGDSGNCRRQVTVDCPDCGKTHAECIDNQCQIRPGDGPQSCSSECGQAYNVCVNEACVYRAGPLRDGDVLCASDNNCKVRKDEHLECRNEACVIVAGAGANRCSTDANCKTYKPTHNVCQNNACITVAGAGSSQCLMNSDCSGKGKGTPPSIPNTGAETAAAASLLGSGILGFFVRKLKFGAK